MEMVGIVGGGEMEPIFGNRLSGIQKSGLMKKLRGGLLVQSVG